MEINSKKGKVMRESETASSILPLSPTKPGARIGIITGIKISIKTTNKPTKQAKTEIDFAAKRRACFRSSQASF